MGSFAVRSYQILHKSRPDDYGAVLVYNSGSGHPVYGRIRFVTTDVGLVFDGGYAVMVNMPADAFRGVVDTLRNEKPVYFTWNDTWGGLYTGNEPPGEEESA